MVEDSDSVNDDIALLIRKVDRIREIVEAFDDPKTQRIACRAQKLLPTLERLRHTPYAGLFEKNAQALKTSLPAIQQSLSEILELKKDYQVLGEPGNTLERLKQELGSNIVDFALTLTVDIPDDEGDNPALVISSEINPHFPPPIEEVRCVEPHDHSMDLIAEALGEGNCAICKIPWSFAPRSQPVGNVFNSMSHFSLSSHKDRKDLYSAIRKLRNFSQQEPIKNVKVVLANLEPGDTSNLIYAAQAVSALFEGTIHAAIALPVALANLDVSSLFKTPTSGAFKGASRFTHFLLEFELENNGGLVTMENCVDDIYLYHGTSSRKEKYCVFDIPLIPGLEHAPDSLQRKVTLGDLIKFRNLERRHSYAVFGNNCKDFACKALSGGLFPPANNAMYDFSCDGQFLSSEFVSECALRYGFRGTFGGCKAHAFR